MKKIFLLNLLIFSLAGLAQKNGAKYLPEHFFNCWSASFEEDKENDQLRTYRLCSYQFPPRMFRPTVRFNKDGTCQVLHVGPTDNHYFVDCTWLYDKKRKRVTVIDKDKVVQFKFKIRLLEKDVMKVIQEVPA